MYIEEAYKGLNHWWRVVLVFLLSTAIFTLNFAVIYLWDLDTQVEMEKMMEMIPNKNLFLVVNLLPFAFLLGMLF